MISSSELYCYVSAIIDVGQQGLFDVCYYRRDGMVQYFEASGSRVDLYVSFLKRYVRQSLFTFNLEYDGYTNNNNNAGGELRR